MLERISNCRNIYSYKIIPLEVIIFYVMGAVSCRNMINNNPSDDTNLKQLFHISFLCNNNNTIIICQYVFPLLQEQTTDTVKV